MSGLPTWEGQDARKNEIARLDLPMMGSPIFRGDQENQETAMPDGQQQMKTEA
jgi:hypothetical protein